MAKKAVFGTSEWIAIAVVGVVAVIGLVMIFSSKGVGFFGPRMECTPGERTCTSDGISGILLACDSTGHWFSNRCTIGCDPIKKVCKRSLPERGFTPPTDCRSGFEIGSYRCGSDGRSVVGTYTLNDCTSEERVFIRCSRGCAQGKCRTGI